MDYPSTSNNKLRARAGLCGLLVCSMLMLSLPARADIIDTERMLAQPPRTAALSRVENFMAQDQVRTQLLAWGVAPEAVSARIAALSDVELQQLAAVIETEPAGGVLGLIGAVFVVLLILELVGLINIFHSV